MKKSHLVVAAGLMALTFAACDATTDLCIEEYNCATNHWCHNGSYRDEQDCEDTFYDRYDYCLKQIDRTRASVTGACWEAYSDMNSCIWSHTSCKEDYRAYAEKVNDIIYTYCRPETQNYADVCGVRFEDAYLDVDFAY